MSADTIVFIIVMAIGVILICISIFIQKQSVRDRDSSVSENGFVTVDKVNQDLLQSISDADSAIEQLHSMSEMILSEVQDKYKELLFLYQLIDEKKAEVEKLNATQYEIATAAKKQPVNLKAKQNNRVPIVDTVVKNTIEPEQVVDTEIADEYDSVAVDNETSSRPTAVLPTSLDERYKAITEMKNSGKTIHQIAKELNIGQGEVKLILDLVQGD